MTEEKKPTIVTLVRHGKTERNREKVLQGHYDSPLTAEGIDHAQEVATKMLDRLLEEVKQELVQEVNQVSILTSDLSRCVDTAAIIAVALEISQNEIREHAVLRERNYGDYSGTPGANFFESLGEIREEDAKQNPPVSIWESEVPLPEGGAGGDEEFSGVEVETYGQMAERILDFLRIITTDHQGERVIAVSHGAYIHALLLLLSAETENSLDAREIYNMAQIDIEVSDSVSLEANEDGNLELTGVNFMGAHDLRKPQKQNEPKK